MAAAREEWKREQAKLDPDRLVFIDETGTNTAMTRLRGRCKRGERLIGHAPYGHRKTTTFVAGLRKNAITAPLVIDQAMNGEIFVAWLVQFLIPTLIAGDIVVMDNLPVHKILAVRALIEAAGAKLLYLPPICRTSIPSKWPSPSSRPCCVRPPNERSRDCGPRSANSSPSSLKANAPTISGTQAMREINRKML